MNLPLTERQLNTLQPDSFAISRERAWSLYPLRIDLRGLAADGQTPTRQWQADAASVGASVSLPSLLRGELRVQNLDLADLIVRLRPRPTPEQDFADLKAFFPVIRGRDPEAPAQPAPPESDAALLLTVEDIHLSGEHEFWVSHIRGTIPGELRGTFSLDAARGLIGFTRGDLDLALTSLHVADDPDVAGDASIRGKVEVPPFAGDEVEGLAALNLLTLEADVDVPVHSLHFINRYLRDIDGIELNGAGRMRGHLDYDRGDLRSDTDLIIEAHDLALDLARFAYVGEGVIELTMDGKRILVHDAMLGSDKLNVGIKGLADAVGREGIVYVRWHDITGTLRIKGDERHFDLVNARPEFDAYVPGHTALAFSSDSPRVPEPAAAQSEDHADPAQPTGDYRRPAARVKKARTESDDPFVWGD